MIRQIRDYFEQTGYHVGYKPAGGISKAKDALTYLALMKEELGDRWLQPDLFDLVLPVFWGISNDNLNILCRATTQPPTDTPWDKL